MEEVSGLLNNRERGPISRALDGQAVRQWLSGQRAAAERIETERAAFFAFLSPERSLQIYLELWSLCGGKCSETLSPLLLAMRRALSRMEGGKK